MATKKYPHINLPGAMLALRVRTSLPNVLLVATMSADRLAHQCSELVRTARSLQRINEDECNVALSDQGERARSRRKMKLRTYAQAVLTQTLGGGRLVFNGDPRGPSVEVHFVTQQYNLGHE